MFKILYLTQHPQIGGGETALLYLISKLDKKRFQAHVILPQKGQFYNRLKKTTAKIYLLNLPPYLNRFLFVPGFSVYAAIKLLKLTYKINPDLVHVNNLTLALYAGIVAKILKILPAGLGLKPRSEGRQVPAIGTAHGVWDSLYFYQNIIYKLFIKKIIANTKKTADNLYRHGYYPKENIKTFHFGIDTNFFRPPSAQEKLKAKSTLNIPSHYSVVSCVGRLDPQKDHLTFLRSSRLIIEKTKSVYFLIVGSEKGNFSDSGAKGSYLKTLYDFTAKNSQLEKHLRFIPYQQNLTTVYRATDISVSTASSIAESFGLALLEAASCGIPIVSTKTASQQLIVKNGKTGFLTPPKRPDLLAQKILILAGNYRLRKEFGENGRKHVTAHFQLQDYVASVEKIYLSLLTNRLKSKRS